MENQNDPGAADPRTTGAQDAAQPGTESVWDYPRPPAAIPSTERIRIVLGGETILDTTDSVRVLETSHPPVYYVRRDDVAPGVLSPAPGASVCEFKGRAAYLTLRAGDRVEEGAAWTYPKPNRGYEQLRDRIAIYPSRMDECTVDGERVVPQEGDFYGGWITSRVRGPFKGGPGTLGW